MRNLFALVGFVFVVFLGAGWYLNWYQLDFATGSDGRTKIGLDVDTHKVAGDLKSGARRAGEIIDNFKTASNGPTKSAEDEPDFVGPPAPPPAWLEPKAVTTSPAAGLPVSGGSTTDKR
jgi:hypothetical protein